MLRFYTFRVDFQAGKSRVPVVSVVSNGAQITVESSVTSPPEAINENVIVSATFDGLMGEGCDYVSLALYIAFMTRNKCEFSHYILLCFRFNIMVKLQQIAQTYSQMS